MKNGLFDLTGFESAGMDDVMKLNLFGEGAGGVGVSETPDGKPYDAAAIPVPKGTVISAETYNSTITALKKSFKEGAEIMEMLENATIVANESAVDQDSFTENAIYDAMVESYYSGPIFEAVQREDKGDVKEIAKKVRKAVCKFTRQVKWYFRKDVGNVTGNKLGFLDPFIIDKLSGELKLHSWQTVCILFPARGTTIGQALSSLNEEFKDILGDFELKAIKMGIMLGAFGGIDEVTEEDKAATRKLSKYYVLIVDAKKAKSPEEIEVKINKSDLAKLLKAQEAAGEDKK